MQLHQQPVRSLATTSARSCPHPSAAANQTPRPSAKCRLAGYHPRRPGNHSSTFCRSSSRPRRVALIIPTAGGTRLTPTLPERSDPHQPDGIDPARPWTRSKRPVQKHRWSDKDAAMLANPGENMGECDPRESCDLSPWFGSGIQLKIDTFSTRRPRAPTSFLLIRRRFLQPTLVDLLLRIPPRHPSSANLTAKQAIEWRLKTRLFS